MSSANAFVMVLNGQELPLAQVGETVWVANQKDRISPKVGTRNICLHEGLVA